MILVTRLLANGEKTFLVETYDDNNTSLNITNVNNPMGNETSNIQKTKKIINPIHKNQTFSEGDYSYAKHSAKSYLNFYDRK